MSPSAIRRMRMARPLVQPNLRSSKQQVAARQERSVADVEVGAALDRESAGRRTADQESR